MSHAGAGVTERLALAASWLDRRFAQARSQCLVLALDLVVKQVQKEIVFLQCQQDSLECQPRIARRARAIYGRDRWPTARSWVGPPFA